MNTILIILLVAAAGAIAYFALRPRGNQAPRDRQQLPARQMPPAYNPPPWWGQGYRGGGMGGVPQPGGGNNQAGTVAGFRFGGTVVKTIGDVLKTYLD